MRLSALLLMGACMLCACSLNPAKSKPVMLSGKVEAGMPAIDQTNAIYELAVREGLTYQDVTESLKSLALSMNFVNPANFSITEHIKNRGIDPHGIKEVQSFCNLSLGTEIFLDHPEFLVFAPCRIAIYEKPDANQRMRLFIALARPTYDLSHIKQPSMRAQQAAIDLETSLLSLINKASKGDF
jgi:uncharacterized protein (DUF302 family)